MNRTQMKKATIQVNKDLINSFVKCEVAKIVYGQYAEEQAIQSIIDAEME